MMKEEKRGFSPRKAHRPLQVRDDLANHTKDIKIDQNASSALAKVTSTLLLDGMGSCQHILCKTQRRGVVKAAHHPAKK